MFGPAADHYIPANLFKFCNFLSDISRTIRMNRFLSTCRFDKIIWEFVQNPRYSGGKRNIVLKIWLKKVNLNSKKILNWLPIQQERIGKKTFRSGLSWSRYGRNPDLDPPIRMWPVDGKIPIPVLIWTPSPEPRSLLGEKHLSPPPSPPLFSLSSHMC